ncbi:MAG: DUF2520 domain-containing protein [Brumimicrobium sp.]|nr:DUF2520 domain-containing protein [Brumimicrobium sp.]
MKNIEEIIIAGTGNVAHRLGQEFVDKSIRIKGIYGRNKLKSRLLADKLNTRVLEKTDEDFLAADLIIVCVSDSVLNEVIGQFPNTVPVVFTSGGISLKDFNGRQNIGVFYPLQTLSKEHSTDFSKIPLLIESDNKTFEEQLLILGKKISKTVRITSSEERLHLHIAAVFANNFTNHLFALAEKHLKSHGIPFYLLKPLIEETVAKLEYLTPDQAQTGPALRSDTKVMEKHLEQLEGDMHNIYEILSASILSKRKKSEL